MTMDAQTVLFALGAALAGFAAGWAHFASLERVAQMIVDGKLGALALQGLRLVLLGLFLWLCTRGGAPVLIAGAAGIMVARAVVLRKARR